MSAPVKSPFSGILNSLTGDARERFLEWALSPEVRERLSQAPSRLNSAGIDPWGFDPELAKVAVASVSWLYEHYFRVETLGIERVPAGKVLLVSNHSGGIPIDGLLIGLSMLLEATPPRIAHGMVERWAPTLPFISSLFTRLGQVVGDPRNCRELLDAGECVMVFPEGLRGIGKRISQAYELQRFGSGFVRLALESGAPIVPVAVIGCEETFPQIAQLKTLGKLLGLPYLPITPFFPLLGPLGAIPLPAKVTLRYGEPILLKGDPDAPDREIEAMVAQVRGAIERELRDGLAIRGKNVFSGAAK